MNGTNELPKDGFDWIALNVFLKGPEKVKCGCFATFANCLKNGLSNFSLFLVYSFLGDDIDQLSRDGFHWIIQKVIHCQGRKGQVWPIFS